VNLAFRVGTASLAKHSNERFALLTTSYRLYAEHVAVLLALIEGNVVELGRLAML
jgi:hypothetical protein